MTSTAVGSDDAPSPAGGPPPGRPRPPGGSRLPFQYTESATRQISVAMHLDQGLAEEAYATLCLPRRRAQAPSPGLDLPLLARNAAWLHNRRSARLAGLGITWVVLVVLALVAALDSRLGGGLGARPLAAAVAVLGAGFAWWLALAAAAGWHTATLVLSEETWDPGPGLLPPGREERLARVNRSNLCLYRDDTFPGTGELLGELVLPPVDVGRPARRDEPVRRFTASELHEYLAARLSGLEEDGVTVRNVAHIDGGWADRYPEIYSGAGREPAVDVSPELVRLVADQPSEGARTYLRCQVVSHGGLVVSTLEIRFKLISGVLSWDLSTRLLRPIPLQVLDGLAVMRRGRARLRWALTTDCVADAAQAYLGELLALPRQVLAYRRQRQRAERVLAPRRRDRERWLDAGATQTLRERLQFDREHPDGIELARFQYLDVVDHQQRMLGAVYGGVVAFLTEHNVRVREVRAAQTTYVNNYAKNLLFGSGTAGDFTTHEGNARPDHR